MKKLLIATSNPGKKIEILKALEIIIKEFELLTLDNFPNITEPEETGKTFEENALIKAKYYALATNLPTIADDGGIMIDALNGEPGVRSRRWPGYTATDEELIQMTLEKMKYAAAITSPINIGIASGSDSHPYRDAEML